MKSPFSVDYNNLESVVAFASEMQKKSPQFKQFVVKYPGRENYNITMQRDFAIRNGAKIVWAGDGSLN